ncbi:hypothetical protein BLA18110_00551 [Burkholderia lata]|nr:hypothetical protein BLA18110_00551 [Burkholderia lata]
MPAALGTRGRAGCECWLKPTDSGKFRRIRAGEERRVPARETGRAEMNGRAILTLQKICRIPVGTGEYPARRAVATRSPHCQFAVTTAGIARGIAAQFAGLPSCPRPAFRRHVRNAAIPSRPASPPHLDRSSATAAGHGPARLSGDPFHRYAECARATMAMPRVRLPAGHSPPARHRARRSSKTTSHEDIPCNSNPIPRAARFMKPANSRN